MQNIGNHHGLYVEQPAMRDEQIEKSENIFNEEESEEVLFPHGKTFDGQWQYNAHGVPVGIIMSGGEWMNIDWDIQENPVQPIQQHFILRHLIRIFREVISEMKRIRNQLHH